MSVTTPSLAVEDRSGDFDAPVRQWDLEPEAELDPDTRNLMIASAEIAGMMDALGRGDVEIFTYLLTGHLDGDGEEFSSAAVDLDPERRHWLDTVSARVLDAAVAAATTADDYSGISEGLERFEGHPSDLAADAIDLVGLGCGTETLCDAMRFGCGPAGGPGVHLVVGGRLAVACLLIGRFTHHRFDTFFSYTGASAPGPDGSHDPSPGDQWLPDIEHFEPTPEALDLLVGQAVISYFGDDYSATVALWAGATQADTDAAAAIAVVALGEWMWNVRSRGGDPIKTVRRALEEWGANGEALLGMVPSLFGAVDGICGFDQIGALDAVVLAACAVFSDLGPNRYGTEIDEALIQDEADRLRESLGLRFPSTRPSQPVRDGAGCAGHPLTQ